MQQTQDGTRNVRRASGGSRGRWRRGRSASHRQRPQVRLRRLESQHVYRGLAEATVFVYVFEFRKTITPCPCPCPCSCSVSVSGRPRAARREFKLVFSTLPHHFQKRRFVVEGRGRHVVEHDSTRPLPCYTFDVLDWHFLLRRVRYEATT